jgi:hypothetical protein
MRDKQTGEGHIKGVRRETLRMRDTIIRKT